MTNEQLADKAFELWSTGYPTREDIARMLETTEDAVHDLIKLGQKRAKEK